MLPGPGHGELGYLVYDPVEVSLAHGVYIRVGRRIHKVDGVRDTVFAGELHGVQVVTQGAAQREAVKLHARQQLWIYGRGILYVAFVKRQSRVVLHDVDLLLADRVPAKVLLE